MAQIGNVQTSAATAAKYAAKTGKAVAASSNPALDSLAKQTGGTVKGDRVEYKVKGPGYNATRYAYAGETPNMNAPADYGGAPPEQATPNGDQVDTGQPSPQNAQAQPFTQPEAPIQTYEQASTALSAGGLKGNALTNAQNVLNNKYQQAHSQLQAGGTTPPSDPGQAMASVAAATPYEPDTTAVDQVFNEDPVINSIMQGAYDFLHPENQKSSLMSDYKSLYKQSGLDDINEELIDAETVLDGTEDDIRNEVQTAGGLATDSQVQAMTLARNKGLLKRYNQLFAAKTSAEQQLNTMMQLDQSDRQMAMQQQQNQLNTMFQLANFRQQATNAAQESYRWLGAENLYASVGNDPAQLKKVEQVLGIPAGGLALAAANASQERQNGEYMQQLQIRKAEQDVGIGEDTGSAGQNAADQLTFLRDTVKKATDLSGGSGESWIARTAGNLLIGDTKRNRLAAQVETLKSNLLTLTADPNIKKFFGPQMSDSDVRAMQAAATTLNVDSMSKSDMEEELKRMDKIFTKLQGSNDWVRED